MLLREGKKDQKKEDATFHGVIDTDWKISILTPNPKKKGSEAWDRFELYREGQTVWDFLTTEGTADPRSRRALAVRWDFGRGFIALDGKTVSEISGHGSDSKSVRQRGREKPNEAHGTQKNDFDPSNFELVLQAEIEKQHTESALIPPNQNWRIAQRREAKLVAAYSRAMKEKSISIRARHFALDGRERLRCDAYDETRNNLIEAKSNVLRGSIRMAIGELADYARFLVALAPRLAVLLPERPSADLEKLLSNQKIAIVWKSGSGNFEDNSGGQFS